MPNRSQRKAMTRLEARQRVELAYSVASVLVPKTQRATRRDVCEQLLFFKTPVLIEMANRVKRMS